MTKQSPDRLLMIYCPYKYHMTPYCGGGADDPLPRPNPPLYRKKINTQELNTVQENPTLHTVQKVVKLQMPSSIVLTFLLFYFSLV